MKRILFLSIAILFVVGTLFAVTSTKPYEVIELWTDGDAPLTNDIDDKGQLFIYRSQLEVDSVKSPVVLVFPGGGYAQVSMQYEGHAFAKWLASKGFTAVILKYRLPNQMQSIPFDDAQESIKILAKQADSLNIDLSKLGIAGFSAGGHMATIFSNRLVNQSDLPQPSFNILFYPVISFEHSTKGGTRSNLLGEDTSAELIRQYSAQLQVTSRTPKTILFVSDNDDSVPSRHSTLYYNVLKENNVPASLYVFPTGGHGWAMKPDFEYNDKALELLDEWLNSFR